MSTKKLADGTRLARRPNNKATCKLKTTWGNLGVNTDVSYIGNRSDNSKTLKSYILGNLALNYKVNTWLDTFLRFENIFDHDYELVDGYQTPKFSAYLGAKVTF